MRRVMAGELKWNFGTLLMQKKKHVQKTIAERFGNSIAIVEYKASACKALCTERERDRATVSSSSD